MFDFLPTADTIDWDSDDEIALPESTPVAEADLVDDLPDGWTDTGRIKDGKKVVRVYAICRKVNIIRDLMDRLPHESPDHHLGGTCPHCLGTGRYSAHRGHFHNSKCYRCNGKGLLDNRDMAFLQRRMGSHEPICHIVTA